MLFSRASSSLPFFFSRFRCYIFFFSLLLSRHLLCTIRFLSFFPKHDGWTNFMYATHAIAMHCQLSLSLGQGHGNGSDMTCAKYDGRTANYGYPPLPSFLHINLKLSFSFCLVVF